ncbi:hypothetical protein BC830DRAFT_724720 [Chytriomyces sp. MP71]|nr:hypothetical protein BC830DRAFT_724720 [Chytriomyces sp. MP71]
MPFTATPLTDWNFGLLLLCCIEFVLYGVREILLPVDDICTSARVSPDTASGTSTSSSLPTVSPLFWTHRSSSDETSSSDPPAPLSSSASFPVSVPFSRTMSLTPSLSAIPDGSSNGSSVARIESNTRCLSNFLRDDWKSKSIARFGASVRCCEMEAAEPDELGFSPLVPVIGLPFLGSRIMLPPTTLRSMEMAPSSTPVTVPSIRCPSVSSNLTCRPMYLDIPGSGNQISSCFSRRSERWTQFLHRALVRLCRGKTIHEPDGHLRNLQRLLLLIFHRLLAYVTRGTSISPTMTPATTRNLNGHACYPSVKKAQFGSQLKNPGRVEMVGNLRSLTCDFANCLVCKIRGATASPCKPIIPKKRILKIQTKKNWQSIGPVGLS